MTSLDVVAVGDVMVDVGSRQTRLPKDTFSGW
jgi:hypothetical protein